MALDGDDRSDLWGGRSSGGPGCAAEVSEVRLGGGREHLFSLALRSRHRPAPERWVGGGSSRAGVQISLLAFTQAPTPTPTQTSHWGRQITACPPCLGPDEIREEQLPARGDERPPGGQACVVGTQQQLGNMSSTSDILSLTLLGRWRITYAAVSGAAQAGCTGQRLISRTGKHFAGFSHALPASSSTGVRTNVGVAPCLPHTCLLSDLACSF